MRWSQKARLAALPNELLSINFRSSQRAEVELRMTKGILLVAAAGPMSHTDLELKKVIQDICILTEKWIGLKKLQKI